MSATPPSYLRWTGHDREREAMTGGSETSAGDEYAREHGYADAGELRHCEVGGREVDAEVDAAARAAGLAGGHGDASRDLLAGLARAEALEGRLAVEEETLPSRVTVVLVRDGGVVVGRVEVMGADRHLVVGVIEWRRPPGLAAGDIDTHHRAVRRRLLAEAGRVADERGASLALMMPKDAADVGLSANGFAVSGEVWVREAGGGLGDLVTPPRRVL